MWLYLDEDVNQIKGEYVICWPSRFLYDDRKLKEQASNLWTLKQLSRCYEHQAMGQRQKKSADIAACCHYSSSVSFWAHTTDDTTPFIADNALTQDKHFNFQGNLNQLG